METDRPSVKARAGSWHVLQATVPSTDKRPSKKSFSPSATFSGVCGLSAGATCRKGLAGGRQQVPEARWFASTPDFLKGK
jgi:hypothetical protein